MTHDELIALTPEQLNERVCELCEKKPTEPPPLKYMPAWSKKEWWYWSYSKQEWIPDKEIISSRNDVGVAESAVIRSGRSEQYRNALMDQLGIYIESTAGSVPLSVDDIMAIRLADPVLCCRALLMAAGEGE